jgi:hypothetical protein
VTDLAILYEHPEWFLPLFAALDRRGVSYEAIRIDGHTFDPEASPPPAPVVFNRVAMSSFLREPEHAIFYAQSLFAHWEGLGARVINGVKALAVDTSKARQLSLFKRMGAQVPATRVVHRRADIMRAAAELRFPILVKADIGGAGAGIDRFDDPEFLQPAVETGVTPVGVNGIALVQEYAPSRDGKITRIETLEGRFLYAIDIAGAAGTFDLCPADACLAQPGKPAITMTKAEPPAELIAVAEAIMQAAGVDVGGVEYLVDDRDGVARFYDLNVLSNFVAKPVDVLGFDPHEPLVDFLVRQIAAAKESR